MRTRLEAYLLPLFAVATLFPRLLHLPPPLQQVQLTELLFPVLLWVYGGSLARVVLTYRVFFLVAGCYVVVNFLAAIEAQSIVAILEAAARVYLLVMAAITIAYVGEYGSKRLERWWYAVTVGVALVGVSGYVLILLGMPNLLGWVAWFEDYPYLGRVARLRGTANTYGMWVMLLLPGWLLAYRARSQRQPQKWWGLSIITLGLLPSLSKEILLLPIGMLLGETTRSTWKRIAVGVLCSVLWLGTHYLIRPVGTAGSDYTGNETGIVIAGFSIVESVYTPIKRAAWEVGLQHEWLGVGPGRFAAYAEQTVAAEALPPGFGPFDPHSAWTGAFAETGLLGLLGLVALVGSLWYYRPEQWTVAAVLLTLFLITTVFKDVMNFRGLWVLVGWYLATCDRPTSNMLTSPKTVP